MSVPDDAPEVWDDDEKCYNDPPDCRCPICTFDDSDMGYDIERDEALV